MMSAKTGLLMIDGVLSPTNGRITVSVGLFWSAQF